MTANLAIVLIAALALFTAVSSAQAGTYYVAPSGSDSSPGTLQRPFATLQRARQAARKEAGREAVTVFLREGTFYLRETLIFTAADSGTRTAPVVYQAYQQEHPVISGGVRLENLNVRRNIIWADHYLPAGGMPDTPWGKEMDYNLVHREGERIPQPATQLAEQSRRDAHSIVADAMFFDPAKGDIRVKEGSPALKLGFVNFPGADHSRAT